MVRFGFIAVERAESRMRALHPIRSDDGVDMAIEEEVAELVADAEVLEAFVVRRLSVHDPEAVAHLHQDSRYPGSSVALRLNDDVVSAGDGTRIDRQRCDVEFTQQLLRARCRARAEFPDNWLSS